MLFNQVYGKLKFFFRAFSFFSRINPRYQLSLDSDYFDIKEKKVRFRFKSFGDHSFPEFTFEEIKLNSAILFTINPCDLIKIAERSHIQETLKSQLKVEEILRNNLYILSNAFSSNTFTGDEICDNPLLVDQIVKSDLFKIAYNTGFSRGRKLSKSMHREVIVEAKSNVIELKIPVKLSSGE